MEEHGPPDLVIKGLSLWFYGRAFPDAIDRWDQDANRCRAVAEAHGARVELSGFVASSSVYHFTMTLERLYERLEGEARLDCSDLGLNIGIKPTLLGHLVICVEMTPDYGASQSHRFAFEGDQTDLLPILRQMRVILDRLPSALHPRTSEGPQT